MVRLKQGLWRPRIAVVELCLRIGCGRIEEPFVGDCLFSFGDTIVQKRITKISTKPQNVVSDRKYIHFIIKIVSWRLDCITTPSHAGARDGVGTRLGSRTALAVTR